MLIPINDLKEYTHPSICNLVWYEETENRLDYNPVRVINKHEEMNLQLNETSMILSSCKVDFPKDDEIIEPVQYVLYPKTVSYAELTPKQRGRYIQFLSNPYAETKDIGYLYLLFEGLERFLLTDSYEQAYSAIMHLREFHKDKQFQKHAIETTLMVAIFRADMDRINEILSSFDYAKEEIRVDLFLYTAYNLNIPLTNEILKLYSKELKIGRKKISVNPFYLKDIINADDVERLQPRILNFFMNPSLRIYSDFRMKEILPLVIKAVEGIL